MSAEHATGVAATAVAIAWARALEDQRPDTLVHDPYAAEFVRAAGPLPFDTAEGAQDHLALFCRSRYVGIRTWALDGLLTAAADAGIRQFVLLAAGLDARAYRLDWPDGTTVFELDRPAVLAFKDGVLGRLGARPRCARTTVATDLVGDWPAALTAAGFRPGVPTGWLAEGLLFYLTPAEEDTLLDRVTAGSVPGSRLAVETVEPGYVRWARERRVARTETGPYDIAALMDADDRPDLAERLDRLGWTTTTTTAGAVATRLGRPVDELVPLRLDTHAFADAEMRTGPPSRWG